MKASIAGTIATAATVLISAATFAVAADQPPMVVGLIAGTTGAYGSTGVATVNGAQLAVDKINADGGVLGRKLRS